jgi:hypothetical protein
MHFGKTNEDVPLDFRAHDPNLMNKVLPTAFGSFLANVYSMFTSMPNGMTECLCSLHFNAEPKHDKANTKQTETYLRGTLAPNPATSSSSASSSVHKSLGSASTSSAAVAAPSLTQPALSPRPDQSGVHTSNAPATPSSLNPTALSNFGPFDTITANAAAAMPPLTPSQLSRPEPLSMDTSDAAETPLSLAEPTSYHLKHSGVDTSDGAAASHHSSQCSLPPHPETTDVDVDAIQPSHEGTGLISRTSEYVLSCLIVTS